MINIRVNKILKRHDFFIMKDYCFEEISSIKPFAFVLLRKNNLPLQKKKKKLAKKVDTY